MGLKIHNSDPGMFVGKWTLSGAEEGEAVRIPAFIDKHYEFWGTWGGATGTVLGSFDPADPPAADSWVILKRLDTLAAVAETATAAGALFENPIWVKPRTTGGTGSALFFVLSGKYVS